MRTHHLKLILRAGLVIAIVMATLLVYATAAASPQTKPSCPSNQVVWLFSTAPVFAVTSRAR
jgi:hypothetical protein